MNKIKWKNLDKNQSEGVCKNYEFYITKQASNFIVDAFDIKIKDNDKAHLASDNFETMEEAKTWCLEFNSKFYN